MIKPFLKKIATLKRRVQRYAKYDKKNVADEIRGVKANSITSRLERNFAKAVGSPVAMTELDSNHVSSLVIAETTFVSRAKNILTNLLTLSIIADASQVAGTNEEQTISFDAVPDAGNWSLALGIESTSSLAYNASNVVVQAALNAIPGLETATVTGNYTLGFTVVMQPTSYPLLTEDSNTLTSSSNPVTITILETGVGIPAIDTQRVDVVGPDMKVHCLTGATNADVKALIEASPANDLITVTIEAGQDATTATEALDEEFTGGL